jgi:sulfate adenylyltransferase subunit 2
VQTSERKLSQLRQLEAESIQIIREAAAEFDNPVMMYSVGKDSSVMLRLAEKAFAPGPLPFPLLHVDTTWKFQDMYRYRDIIESKKYTDVMKTEGLKQALTKHEFDCAFGGARRDEEKSRAKERIFSFRDSHHQWDPKNQRPELWNVYNAKIKKGENVRVFPLSNWTELDVWLYVWLEDIPVVPLYFAKERPVVERSGTWILVDDDRMRLEEGEEPQMKKVRFRTLGCYPLSGAVESDADTVPKVIQEMLLNRFSERQGRLIDFDEEGSMEVKKREGYF